MRSSDLARSPQDPRPATARRRPARHAALILALAFVAASSVRAEDLGVVGPVYAIAEPSLLEMIRSSLREMEASGVLARLQRESQARIRREIEQPESVAGITRTTRVRSFEFDPSIEVPYPITDAQGRVIVAPGTRVNPLDVVSLSRPLLFIDARDATQVDEAQQLISERHGQLKLILTGGSYVELMRRWKRPVFFDQQGRLTAQLGIHHVPALVTQAGKRLHIDELL